MQGEGMAREHGAMVSIIRENANKQYPRLWFNLG